MGCCKVLNCLDLEELGYKSFCCCECITFKSFPGPFCVKRSRLKEAGWGVEVCCNNYKILAFAGHLGEEIKQQVIDEIGIEACTRSDIKRKVGKDN